MKAPVFIRPLTENEQQQIQARLRSSDAFHYSKQVRTWIREHNQQVKQEGKGVRILPFFLPKQSPWLNPIEPKCSAWRSTPQYVECFYECGGTPHLAM